MTSNKALYFIIGILAGIIAILIIGKIPTSDIIAAPLKQNESVSNQNFIAIGSMSKTDNNLLWLIDTNKKKLLLYEYYQETVIKLKAVRDIQYDVDAPDGVTFPTNRKDDEPKPTEVKDIFDRIRKTQKDKEEREQKEKDQRDEKK